MVGTQETSPVQQFLLASASCSKVGGLTLVLFLLPVPSTVSGTYLIGFSSAAVF